MSVNYKPSIRCITGVLFMQIWVCVSFSQSHNYDPIFASWWAQPQVSNGTHSLPIGLIKNLSSPVLYGGCSTSNGVDLYSGTNRILVPLFSLNAKGFEIPVSIGYTGSGIKVNQLSGPVGIGWSLNAGGCVRRIMNNVPDDNCAICSDYEEGGWMTDNNGLCTIAILNQIESISSDIQDYNPIDSGRILIKHLLGGTGFKHDLEPDRFVIDCPYISGEFIFSTQKDQNNKPIIRSIGQTNMKFEYTLTTGNEERIDGFLITDEWGNKYHFCGNNETFTTHKHAVYEDTSQNQTFYLNGNFGYTSQIDRVYKNAWFLQRIDSYLGDTIFFTYEMESFVTDPSYVNFIKGENASPPPINPYKRFVSQILESGYFFSNPEFSDYIETYRISSISGSNFLVNFLSFSDREDITHYINAVNTPPQHPCKRIDKIMVYNRFGPSATDTVLSRIFDLEYYYTENVSCNASNTIPYCCNYTAANKRLFLNKVTESTKYNAFMPYEFSYEPGSLPNRYTYAKDIYGCYNNQTGNTTDVPEVFIYPEMFEYNDRFWFLPQTPCTGDSFTLVGANRQFNEPYAKIGLLKKVKYPSGVEVRYDYQPHEFLYKQRNIVGAGFRLESKITFDNEQIVEQEHYAYEGGRALGFPVYGYYDPSNPIYSLSDSNYKKLLHWNCFFVRTGANIGISDGAVGYDKVKIIRNINGGSTEYYFENKPTLDDPIATTPSEAYYIPEGLQNAVSLVPQNDILDDFKRYDLDVPAQSPPEDNHLLFTYPYPYRDFVNVNWFRGRITKSIDKNNNNDTVKSVEFTYEDRYKNSPNFGTLPDQEIIYGIKASFLDNFTSKSFPVAAVNKYAIYTGVVGLLSSKKTTFHLNNGKFTTQEEYTYNEAGLPEISKTTNSDGTVIYNRKKWLYDFYNARKYPNPNGYYATPSGLGTWSLFQMAYQNLPNTLIEETKEVRHGNEAFVVNGNLTTYRPVTINGSTKFLPEKKYILNTLDPLPLNINFNNHFLSSGISSLLENPSFYFDSRYKPFYSALTYHGSKLLEEKRENDITTTFIWDDYLDLKIGTAVNCNLSECRYTGFEFGRTSTNGAQSSSGGTEVIKSTTALTSFAGKYCLKISPSGYFYYGSSLQSTDPDCNGYKASVWIKGSQNLQLKIRFMYNGTETYSKSVLLPVQASDWQYLTVNATKSDLEGKNYNYFYLVVSNTSSSDCYIDEVKLYPSDAIITTENFAPENLLLASSSNNDIYTYFEYDDAGRNIMTRDFDRNILTSTSYNSRNPANFSICDCSSNGTGGFQNEGKFEVNEPLTISSNSCNVSDAIFQYSIDNGTFSSCNGKFQINFTSSGDHSMTMKTIIDGDTYTFTRKLIICNQ